MSKVQYPKRRFKNHAVFGNKWVRLSHLVWWENTGHKPLKGEVIHHIDENPFNNSIENLQLMTQSEHIKFHIIKRGGIWNKGKTNIYSNESLKKMSLWNRTEEQKAKTAESMRNFYAVKRKGGV